MAFKLEQVHLCNSNNDVFQDIYNFNIKFPLIEVRFSHASVFSNLVSKAPKPG